MHRIIILLIALSPLFCQSQGQDPNLINVDKYLQRFLERSPVPGFSIAIVEGDKLKFSKGYGVARSNSSKPMSVNATMAISSIARGFTAMAILQLVEQEKLNLDTPIIEYLPWFATANKDFSDQITLRMCLSNTTGIPPQFESLPNLEEVQSSESFVRSLEGYYVKKKPGSSHEFSDEGYSIAGLIISEVTGMAYADYIERYILNPLEMKGTTTKENDISRFDIIEGHEIDLEQCVPAIHGVTDGNYVAAGSQFYSNTKDLGNYLIALLNGGRFRGKSLLKPESIEELFKGNTSFQGLGTMLGGNGIDIEYALGWMGMSIEERDIMIHTGNNGKVASIIGINRAKNQAFAMLFNADVNTLDRFEYPGMEHTVNNVIHILNAEDTSDFGVVRQGLPDDNTYVLPTDKWNKYIGTYESIGKGNPFFRDMNITVSQSADDDLELLVMREEEFKGRYKLEFTNETRAILRSIALPRSIQFSIYPDGFVGGLFMFGSEFKKEDTSQKSRFDLVVSEDDSYSFLWPKDVAYNWTENKHFEASFADQTNTSLLLSSHALRSQSFEELINQSFPEVEIISKGGKSQEPLRDGVWTEQVIIVREAEELKHCVMVLYQDPVSNKQLQLLFRTPWGKMSIRQQELLANLRKSIKFIKA